MKPSAFRILSKTLAVILCLILVTPVGTASPGQSEPTAPVAENAGPEPAQPLSAEEEQSLSERAEEPGAEVVGGALSNLHLTYIVIALAAAVLVLVLK